MKNIPFIGFLIISIATLGQKPPAKFGDIPMEDMTMKIYPLDSSASAVLLFDYGLAYVPSDFERHTRIKILKKEGLQQANAVIFLQQRQALKDLKAATYNLENGKIVQTNLLNDGKFDENLTGGLRTYTFTLPNVKEGSVIEYSYKLTAAFNTSWSFQRFIPVRLSEYWMIVPNYLSFERKMQGFTPLTSYEEKIMKYFGENVKGHHFTCEDVPAFANEPLITTSEDYISKITFYLSRINGGMLVYGGYNQEIMSSWETLNKRLTESENFMYAVIKSDFLKEHTDKIIAGLTDTPQRLAAISNYVKNNFEWNKSNTVATASLKKVIEKKKGGSGDLNLLMGAMLNQAGYNVDMILISTRDHGLIRRETPTPEQFNYSICSVKALDKTYLLDATEKYLPYDVLPSRCLNGQGLMISKTNFGWVDITTKAKEKTTVGAEFTLSEAGVLDGKINYAYDGYDALKFRKDYSDKGEEDYSKQFISDKQWTVVKNEFKDIKETDKSAKAFYEINIDEHATKAGDIIYINPFVANKIDENPFKSEKRLYPVDYGSKIEKVYNCKFAIPEGFIIDELPKSKIIAMPENGARYTYNVVQLNNAINITSNFQINKTIFVPDEYELLREFYNQVVAKQAEQIVLKKK